MFNHFYKNTCCILSFFVWFCCYCNNETNSLSIFLHLFTSYLFTCDEVAMNFNFEVNNSGYKTFKFMGIDYI